jgi:hypothetical protein
MFFSVNFKEDNIQICLERSRVRGCERVLFESRQRPIASYCERGSEHPGSVTGKIFID